MSDETDTTRGPNDRTRREADLIVSELLSAHTAYLADIEMKQESANAVSIIAEQVAKWVERGMRDKANDIAERKISL